MINNKIVIFLGGYLPAKKYGGPVTSIANLVDNLGDRFEFYIISNDHDLDDYTRLPGIHEGWNQVGKAKVLYIKEKDYKKKNFVSILKEIRPSVIYLSSVFYFQMNFPAIQAAKSVRIPVILAPRGEICQGALMIGRTKKNLYLKFINLIKLFDGIYYHVTSDEEYRAVMDVFSPNEKHIYQIPNMPCSITGDCELEKNKGELSIVYLSRIVEKKNLLFAIKAIKKCDSIINLSIYGPKENESYWQKCEEEMNELPDNVTTKYIGSVEPGQSKSVFSKYHLFIFPTQSENYGHVIVEAISSSCPILISKGTTPWDDIDGNGGFVVSLEQIDKWRSIIDRIALMDNSEYSNLRKQVKRYSREKLRISELKTEYEKMFKTE